MNCKIEFKCINLSDPVQATRAFYIDILISEQYHFRTIEHRSTDKKIPICEQMELDLNQQLQFYIKAQIWQLTGTKQQLIDTKVFYSTEIQKLQKYEFQIPTKGKRIDASIDCSIYLNNSKINQHDTNILARLDRFGKKLKKQIHEIKEQTPINNLQIIKIGEQSYKLANRLDNIIKIKHAISHYLNWTNPNLTLIITFILTFIIFNPRIFVVVACSIIIYSRQHVMNLLENLSNFLQFHENRLILPQTNVAFIKQINDQLCEILDSTKSLFHDPLKIKLKVLLSKYISILWIPIATIIIFTLQQILVILLWIKILSRYQKTSTTIKLILKITNDTLGKIQRKFIKRPQNKIAVDSNKIEDSNGGIQEIVVKNIFVYQYQRQWFGKFNTKDTKIADQSSYIKMNKDKYPHPHYQWIGDWKVVIDSQTDLEGYTYSADIVHKYHKQRNLLDALRRRKWIRKCAKTPSVQVKQITTKIQQVSSNNQSTNLIIIPEIEKIQKKNQ